MNYFKKQKWNYSASGYIDIVITYLLGDGQSIN